MAGGLYSPSAGDVLTAANAIDFWSKQVVIICTSGTRPGSPRSGMTIWQTDTSKFAVYGTAWCETTPQGATVATSETTASTTYAALATSGPAVTALTTGTKALVTIGASFGNSVATSIDYMSYAVSSASTIASADTKAMIGDCTSAAGVRTSQAYVDYTAGLTAGSNTFTAQYRTNANTGTWENRRIAVEAIPT